MSSNNRLYRNFVILQEDERGYSNSKDKTLSGYSKIEAKGDKCKVSFYAQNLRKDDDKYYMMIICCKKDTKQIVNLGPMEVSDTGKGEETKEYSISNIAGLDLEFDKISGTAIAKIVDGIPIFVMCGFLNGQQPSENWKNYKLVKANETKGKYSEKLSDKYQKKENRKEEDNKEKKIKDKKSEEKQIEDSKEEREVDSSKEEKQKEKGKEEKSVENAESEEVRNAENDKAKKEEESIKEERELEKGEGEKVEGNINVDTKTDEDNSTSNNEVIINDNIPRENLRGKFDEYEEQIENNKEFDPNTSKIRGSIGEYFETIVEGFERDYSSITEIKYTKWYKIQVHDLHEMCNMSNYNKYTLAYYPMLNYYPYIKKYGYFMLGYKCDSKGNLKHIIYGIPGGKDKNEQPYDGRTGFVTWVNINNNDTNGCWLMFYDFKNSTVVVPMQ